ncbi:unnamed protein product [Bursaphelenchus xylophilus]|uniref:Pseudouridylate synthase RPUSD4, mitochondrial n=1 Tax=Bursaphelenchus xylophilus TaxID=6326 RepID=A0A1I7S1F0_BURXY|nr:unnamed protein product [Bursaphelenchus xylophilus]CAG9081605.1 unnamed protein product [Bursaphelenchus xylophilus]
MMDTTFEQLPSSAKVVFDQENPIVAIQGIFKLTPEEFVDFLEKRVIYNADDLIAIDKPMMVPYSGSKSGRLQIDRVLQDLKKRIAPDIDRLHLIESLDRAASGVLLFAKTADRQKQLQEAIKDGRVQHRFRCIVKGLPTVEKANITIPLRKVSKGMDVRLLPAVDNTKEVIHCKTLYSVVNENRADHVSLLDVVVDRTNLHQIRTHLSNGIGCPLIGESKYNGLHPNTPVRLGPRIMNYLGLPETQARKVPMFIHHAEALVPLGNGSRFSVVKAPYSPVFMYAVKALGLMKKR